MRLLQEKRITFAEYNEGIGLNYHESATLIRLGIGVALFYIFFVFHSWLVLRKLGHGGFIGNFDFNNVKTRLGMRILRKRRLLLRGTVWAWQPWMLRIFCMNYQEKFVSQLYIVCAISQSFFQI